MADTIGFHHARHDSAMTRSKSYPKLAVRVGGSTTVMQAEIQEARAKGPWAMEALLQASDWEDTSPTSSSPSMATSGLEEFHEGDRDEVLKLDRDHTIFLYTKECTLREAYETCSDPAEKEVLAQHHEANNKAISDFLASPRVSAYCQDNLMSCAVTGANHIVRTPEYQEVLVTQGWKSLTEQRVDLWLVKLYEAIAEVEAEEAAEALAECIQNLDIGDEVTKGEVSEASDVEQMMEVV